LDATSLRQRPRIPSSSCKKDEELEKLTGKEKKAGEYRKKQQE
jgi:hypothetical protein